MARQNQGRGAASQPATGQPAGRKPSGGGAKARGSGGGASPAAAQAGNGPADRNGRPGQQPAGNPSRNDRPGQKASGNSSRGGRPAQPGGSQARRQDRQQGQRGAAALASQAALADASITRPPAPTWLRWTTLILSLVGLGFSTYLTIAHFTGSAILACPANSFINCGEVTNSPESIIFGVFPVAVLGLAFYVFMVAINSPWAWRSELPAIRWARLGGIVTGMAFVLYLVYAELIEIGKLCEYCTAVHIITFALFVLIVFDASFRTSTASSAVRR